MLDSSALVHGRRIRKPPPERKISTPGLGLISLAVERFRGFDPPGAEPWGRPQEGVFMPQAAVRDARRGSEDESREIFVAQNGVEFLPHGFGGDQELLPPPVWRVEHEGV